MIHTEPIPGADSRIRDKAIRLFNYLKELTELRFDVQRNCDNYEDVIWWAEIPREKECYCVAWDLHKESAFDAWIRVERPRRKRPPLPSAQLREWLAERDINDSSLDVIRSHSTDVLKQIGIVWESVGHLDLFGDQRRDPDWRHEGEDGEDDVDGWTYNVVWWVNRAGLFDVAIVDGSVYIMSDSGQTVESLR